VDAAYNSPGCELDAMRHILSQASGSTHTAAARLTLPDGGLRAPDAAWVADFDRGHNAALALLASGQAFVAQQRMEPLRSFLDAAEAVLNGMCLYTHDAGRALRGRVAWTGEACAALGDVAGTRAEAQACVPPLVARLRLRADDALGTRLLALATTPPPLGQPPPPFALTQE
jgi:hypothetical protein